MLTRSRVVGVFLIAMLVFGLSSAAEAASRATQSVTNDVRKVSITDDNGGTRTIFERRDKFTCAWFEARLDARSNSYVYTPAGEAARRTKTRQIQQFHIDSSRFSED